MNVNLNPKELQWTPPTKYVDGTDFGAADFAGYEWGYKETGSSSDYSLTVAVPVSFDITTLDLTVLELPQNKPIDVVMRTVAKNGQVSDWTNPLPIRFDERKPNPPTALAVGA